MAATVSTSFIVLSRAEWKSVGGQLLASGVLLLSGYQDIGLGWHRALCCRSLL
jgi:hypothetical protein